MGIARVIRGLGLAAFLLVGSVLGGVATAVVTADVAYAQSISVEGNRRVEADTIRSYFRPGPGGRIGPVEIDAALKALYATGLFQDVRISQPGGRIVVTVVENQVINRIAFEGNKRAKDEQLLAEIQSKPRGTLSRPVVQSDVQRIVETYRRNGRFDVSVTPKIIELPNNRVDLVFEIREGEKTGVKKIRFVGNKAYSDFRLKDVIKTTESNLLSFLKNSDIYDPDRMEADRDLLRRFYLKHGFADVRIVSAIGEYDPGQKGFIITFTIEEGDQYRFGAVELLSNVRAIDVNQVKSRLKTKSGAVYNAEAVEKTVEDVSIELARAGYPFATVRPRGERDFERRLINVAFVVDEGSRAYIERINIRGNTRTRDYVIRREFDISEGDAYNRALVDRAERRLKNLNYFKTVKITNEPGSAPDRIVLNVDVEEQSTGEFAIMGGYSTADGWLGEVSVGERNLLGRGQYVRASVQYGQRARGFEVGFVEPYFLGYRMALGLDVFAKETNNSDYSSYNTRNIGGAVRLGFQLREDLTFQVRYSLYQQEITLDDDLSSCFTTIPQTQAQINSCASAGTTVPSLPVRITLLDGATLTSMAGYSFIYNTLDNNKNPTQGIRAEFKQDFAGLGGDVKFIRTTGDARFYQEVFPDIVGVLRLQGGHIAGWGGGDLRFLDQFQMGPNLVRGFRTNGIGPRDQTPNTTQDSLGGTMYWGASVEFQVPLYFIPKDIGIKAAVFADAGSVWNYKGPTAFTSGGLTETMTFVDENAVRASVGAGLIWDSPFGPLRFDYSIPVMKQNYDIVQEFRFGGGTRF
ncbi:MAG: outer membrane protein assembly factor BamA [Pseudorhodoplanes sp.]|jgi:outer membrane protein insertion porin family|nr:outer membrane protein assembly factor BamA [Pseudorhodoplanes sp.]